MCCGIFQGNSFHPVVYYDVPIPCTMVLHRRSGGYRLGSRNAIVNHLLDLDDLKLYGKNRQEIESLVNSVRILALF